MAQIPSITAVYHTGFWAPGTDTLLCLPAGGRVHEHVGIRARCVTCCYALREFNAGRCLNQKKPGGAVGAIEIDAVEEQHVVVNIRLEC